MGITDAQKRELDEQGCIVIPDVLSDEEIEGLQSRYTPVSRRREAERVGTPTHRRAWTACSLVGKQRRDV